jgi:hypothetical protein
MGFQKNNYHSEALGLTLPEAYAAIKNIYIEGDRGNAEFVIQASRENALNLTPLERVYVPFTVNRNENPYKTAYEAAKGTRTVKTPYGKTIEEPMLFNGWRDDVQPL